MPNAFNFAASPFDCLTQQQQRLVREHVDIAYFRAGEVILDVGSVPRHLFVLIKGRVSQFDGDECVARYGPDDSFDGRGLVAGKSSSRFVAIEEVVAYALAHQTVNDLIAANADFGALLFSDLGAKLSAAGQRHILSDREMSLLEMATTIRSGIDRPGLRTPGFELPSWLVRLVGLFDRQIRDNTAELDSVRAVDGNRGRRLIGRAMIPAGDAVIAIS